MTKHYHMPPHQRRALFGNWPEDDDRVEFMTRYEIEREEALECIDYLAAVGRTTEAWRDVRREIQLHFENQPDDGAWMRSNDPHFGSVEQWNRMKVRREKAFAEWLEYLQKLLAMRRDIHKIAKANAAKLTYHERVRRQEFNRVFHQQAAE